MAIRKIGKTPAKIFVISLLSAGLLIGGIYLSRGKDVVSKSPEQASEIKNEVFVKISSRAQKADGPEKKSVMLSLTGVENKKISIGQISAVRFEPGNVAAKFGFSLAMSENYAIAGLQNQATLYIFKINEGDLVFQNKINLEKKFYGRMRIDMTDDHAVVGMADIGRQRPVTSMDFENLRVRNRKSLELTTDQTRSFSVNLFIEPGKIIHRLKICGYLDENNLITHQFHGLNPSFRKNMPGFTQDQCRLICNVLKHIKNRRETGVVHVLINNGGNWEKQDEWILHDATPGTHFGASVAVADTWAFVNANRRQFKTRKYREGIFDLEKPVTQVSSGGSAVFIYRKNKDSWDMHQEVPIPGQSGAVDISGDHAVIGGHDHINDTGGGMFVEHLDMWLGFKGFGMIYILKLEGDKWIKKAFITARDYTIADRGNFGSKLFINDNDMVAVTERDFHLLDYKKPGSRINQTLSPGFFCETGFLRDSSMSLAGRTALAGVAKEAGTGAVFLFQKDATGWKNTGRICPENIDSKDEKIRFGSAVATNGDYALIGAPKSANVAGKECGAVYFFKVLDN